MSEADAGVGERGDHNRLHLCPLGGRDGSGGPSVSWGWGLMYIHRETKGTEVRIPLT